MATAAQQIDPVQARMAALEADVRKLQRINIVLMNRVERSMDLQGNAFSLFETAITLEAKVQDRTRDLERALDALASTNAEMMTARDSANEAQRRLADAIESINEGFVIFDADDRLVLCNQTYLSFWPKLADRIVPGMTFGEIARLIGERGTSLGAMISPDRWISERLAQHSVAEGSHVHALADGRWIQINELRTSEGGIVGVYTDITEVKASDARERAREQAQKSLILQATLDNIRLGVCVYDADRRLTAWNHPLLATVGLPDDAIPRIMTHAGLVATCARLNGPMEDSDPLGWLAGGADVLTQRRHASGRVVEVRRSALADGGMVMSFEDVTERLRQEEARQRANETLERRVEERTADIAAVNVELQQQISERLAVEEALREAKTAAEQANLSKTRFLAAASHDLLQPLNAARLFVSALSDRRLAPATHTLVRQVESALDSVEDLLEALLEISKLDAGAITPNIIDFPLSEVMRSMQAEFQPLAIERGLSLHFADCGAWVRSDARLLRRIVQNFISNALRYTEQGSVIVRCAEVGDMLRIEIEDSGPGIAPVYHREIFNEFRRLDHDTPSRGIGLGLAIVDRASRMLGHPLDLRSAPGQGSTFAVIVPRAAAREVGDVRTAVVARGGLAGRTVLVIDNEAAILAGMDAILSGWGCRAICVPNRAWAAEAMATAGGTIDAIIADYHLDEGDTGDQAVRSVLAAAGRQLPTIIVTADRTPELKDRLTAEGFRWLTKPVKPAQLRALLSQIIR